jgi:DNA-binding transcriptional LysR family regulator
LAVDVRDLRYFLALADELHFGRAADRLHIAQPALSQQLKRLERELGLNLVDRSSRHVRLTDAGERLQVEAAEAVTRFDAVTAAMARVRQGKTGRLILGMSPGVRPQLFRELLSTLAAHAATEVSTRAASGADAAAMLHRHEIDAALVHVVPQAADLAHKVLERLPLGVALPTGHRLARRRAIPARELTGEMLIWVARNAEPQLHDEVMNALRAAGYQPGATQHPPTVDTSLNLVAAGLGVSLKLRHELEQAPRRGVAWRPFADVELSIPTALVWRRGDQSPTLAALRQAGHVASSEAASTERDPDTAQPRQQ